jgi:hypothetical protein
MQRRTFLLTSLLPALLASGAESSEIDPKQTFVLQRCAVACARLTAARAAPISHAMFGTMQGKPGLIVTKEFFRIRTRHC